LTIVDWRLIFEPVSAYMREDLRVQVLFFIRNG